MSYSWGGRRRVRVLPARSTVRPPREPFPHRTEDDNDRQHADQSDRHGSSEAMPQPRRQPAMSGSSTISEPPYASRSASPIASNACRRIPTGGYPLSTSPKPPGHKRDRTAVARSIGGRWSGESDNDATWAAAGRVGHPPGSQAQADRRNVAVPCLDRPQTVSPLVVGRLRTAPRNNEISTPEVRERSSGRPDRSTGDSPRIRGQTASSVGRDAIVEGLW